MGGRYDTPLANKGLGRRNQEMKRAEKTRGSLKTEIDSDQRADAMFFPGGNAELKNFYQSGRLGLCVLDHGLRYVRINERMAAIHGRSVKDHLKRAVGEICPEMAPGMEEMCRRVLRDGQPVLNEEVSAADPADPRKKNHWLASYHPLKGDDCGIHWISVVFQDNTERTRWEHAMDERLRFEQLVSEISAKFVNLQPGKVDKEIEYGLQLIVRFLDIDRSNLLEISEDHKHLQLTHSYAVQGVDPVTPFIVNEQQPWLTQRMLRGETICFAGIQDLPEEATLEKRYVLQQGIQSAVVLPLAAGGAILGAVTFSAVHRRRQWPEALLQRLRLVGEIFANALVRKRGEQDLHRAFLEIRQLKERLEAENIYLQKEIKLVHKHEGIVGESKAINTVLGQAEQVARTDSTVLILGETGTGKELLARTIHHLSLRKDRPMVKVNCTTLPSTLVESELFGREKGAYTGAVSRQPGRFEVADGSTIFLDEIGDLPLELQPKLLRVLQEGQFERLGSSRTIRVNVRVIAATNRDLAKAVAAGQFREDLFYRLKVFPITVPPLRDCLDDIPLLVRAFVAEFGETMGKRIESISRKSMEAMGRYAWPGNIRELRNIIEYAMIMSKGGPLGVQVPEHPETSTPSHLTMEDVQRRHILDVLKKTRGRIKGVSGAAELLGLKPSTLYSRMKKLGIAPPRG